MIREFLNQISIDILREMVDPRIQNIIKSDDNFNYILSKKEKIIDLILSRGLDDLLGDREIRTVILSNFSQEEISTFLQLFNIREKNTKEKFLSFVLNMPTNQKNINLIKSFLGETHSEISNEIPDHCIISANKKQFFELLDYQFVIKEQICSALETDPNLFRAIIHMPTGTGKTKTTVHTVIHDYVFNKQKRGVIVWLAHTKELLEQAYYSFTHIWNNIGSETIRLNFNSFDSLAENNSIFFISYPKLIACFKNNHELFSWLVKNTCAIIADEAHKCLAKETRIVLENLMTRREGENNKYFLGLTATPGRKFGAALDEQENVSLSNMFERRIFSVCPDKINYMTMSPLEYENVEKNDSEIIAYFQKRLILSKVKREILSYHFEQKDIIHLCRASEDKDFSQQILFHFSNIENRNKEIINRLLQLNEDKIPTIFFACSVDHGKFISAMLQVNGIDSRGVYGSTNTKDREQTIRDFNEGKFHILITFEVLTTGFDSPKIQAVFIARPTSSIVLYSQMLGRGLRGPKMGGTSECLLIDVQDNFNKFSNENFAFSYFDQYWIGAGEKND